MSAHEVYDLPIDPKDAPTLNSGQAQSLPAQFVGSGWQCPGCGRIYALWVSSCECQMNAWRTTSDSSRIVIRR